MGDDNHVPPLPQRTPGASGRRAPAAGNQRPPGSSTERPSSSTGQRGLWFPDNPDDDTQPIAVIWKSIPWSAGIPRPASSDTLSLAEPIPRPVPAGRRYRLTLIFAAAVVLLTTGSLALALSGHAAKANPGAGQRAGGLAPTAGQMLRDRAAAWVAGQVSRGVIVSCDPAMCQALAAHKIPPARLLQLGLREASPLRSGVIVATPVVRKQLGDRLDSVYAPLVIASFGSGDPRIDIRAVAPHGAAAYLSAVRADVLARKSSAGLLLHAQRIRVSAAARTQLAEGLVDSRLLVAIADLAAREPISILVFGDSAPGASAGMPLRSADLAGAYGSAGTRDPRYVRAMIGILGAERGAYRPDRIQAVQQGSSQAVLRIQFGAPSPLGLLGGPAPG